MRLSCLIPLYRSRDFFDIVCANVDAHLAEDAEILVSDRHGLDDTAARIAARYAGEARVRVLTARDRGDWVTNINGLLRAARGRYLRILPHDDSAGRDSTMALVEALEANDDAVLAYGVVRAIDRDGMPLPHLDQMNVGEAPGSRGWDLDEALSLFWCGRFQGAFKGVVRADTVRSRPLPITKTPTLVCSERAWLFALALTGRFQFVPDSVLTKRYYAGSTSSGWAYTPQVYADVVSVMQGYCDALIADPVLRAGAKRSLAANGAATIRGLEGGATGPAYRSLHEFLSPS